MFILEDLYPLFCLLLIMTVWSLQIKMSSTSLTPISNGKSWACISVALMPRGNTNAAPPGNDDCWTLGAVLLHWVQTWERLNQSFRGTFTRPSTLTRHRGRTQRSCAERWWPCYRSLASRKGLAAGLSSASCNTSLAQTLLDLEGQAANPIGKTTARQSIQHTSAFPVPRVTKPLSRRTTFSSAFLLVSAQAGALHIPRQVQLQPSFGFPYFSKVLNKSHEVQDFNSFNMQELQWSKTGGKEKPVAQQGARAQQDRASLASLHSHICGLGTEFAFHRLYQFSRFYWHYTCPLQKIFKLVSHRNKI